MANRTGYDAIADQFLSAYMAIQAVGHKERVGLPATLAREEALRTLTRVGAAVPQMVAEAKKELDERGHHGSPTP